MRDSGDSSNDCQVDEATVVAAKVEIEKVVDSKCRHLIPDGASDCLDVVFEYVPCTHDYRLVDILICIDLP